MSERSRGQFEEAFHGRQRIPPWMVLPILLALVLAGILAGRIMGPRPGSEGEPADRPEAAEWEPATRRDGETFSLAIDFGNGAEKRFAALPWNEEMTVLDAMQAAAAVRPGVRFVCKGSGKTAFLTAIDGLENAGAGGGNWIYEVNGEQASVGAGVQVLAPGDRLLWRYSSSE